MRRITPGRRTAIFARISRDWQQKIQADQQNAAASCRLIFKSPAAQQVLDRAAFLNSLIDERSFPWTKIFMDLEQTLPPGVRVVSISPRLVNGRAEVQLKVGAATDESEDQVPRSDREIESVFRHAGASRSAGPNRRVDRQVFSISRVWYSTT